MKNLERIIASLVALAICLLLANYMGFSIEDFLANIHINVESILRVAIVCTFLLSVKYLLKILVSLIKTKKLATFVTILNSAIDYLALILIVVWSLRIMGADINGIIAGIGILALIIGTSAEGLIEDMLTGIFMLFEQECKVGDIVEVDGFLGTISEIGIRTTSIIDNAGNVKIFNNSSMKDILNRSSHASVAVVDIELPTDTDIEQLKNADYGDIKCLGLQEIGSDSITIRYIKETPEAKLYDAQREMNVVILKVLKELGLK